MERSTIQLTPYLVIKSIIDNQQIKSYVHRPDLQNLTSLPNYIFEFTDLSENMYISEVQYGQTQSGQVRFLPPKILIQSGGPSIVFNEKDLSQSGLLCTMIQQRRSNEDRYQVAMLNGNIQMYVVFDGHAGNITVELLDQFFSEKLALALFGVNFIDGDAVMSQIQNVIDRFEAEHLLDKKAGSTMILALVKDNLLYFVNLGDSRAILFDSNGNIYGQTIDHTPDSEKDRIQSLGATVFNNRVYGMLAVSRAFGDIEYKNVNGRYSARGPVSLQADYYRYNRDRTDMYILLASDGLFENPHAPEPSNQEIINEVIQTTFIAGNCESLIGSARMRGSNDDITVVIAKF